MRVCFIDIPLRSSVASVVKIFAVGFSFVSFVVRVFWLLVLPLQLVLIWF